MHIYIYTYTDILHMPIYKHTYIHTYIYIYLYIHVYIKLTIDN